MKPGQLGETTASHLENITDEIERGVQEGRYTWKEIQDTMMEKGRAAAEATDAYVHENPWTTMGIAAGLGLVVGLLLGGGSDE